jgi:hypothetical protein
LVLFPAQEADGTYWLRCMQQQSLNFSMEFGEVENGDFLVVESIRGAGNADTQNNPEESIE